MSFSVRPSGNTMTPSSSATSRRPGVKVTPPKCTGTSTSPPPLRWPRFGTVPRRGERSGAGERDVPVSFGGITFTPGRRLVADEDGVIVLPDGLTEADIAVDDAVAATAAYAAKAGRPT